MTNEFMTNAYERLEQMTDQMVIHQANGDYDMVALLDNEARELAYELDNGQFMTLPQL